MGKNKLKKFIGTIMAALGISFGLNGCSDYSKKSVDSTSTNIAEVNNIENAPFEITFMNVGKADSIFLSIDDKNIMIDTWLNSTKDNVVSQLKEKNIDSVLIEGGGNLNFTFLENKKVNKIYAFVAPKVFGGKNAITPVEGEGVRNVLDAFEFPEVNLKTFHNDILIECNLS